MADRELSAFFVFRIEKARKPLQCSGFFVYKYIFLQQDDTLRTATTVAVLEMEMKRKPATGLAKMVGRTQAFSLIAKRCSAAEAECLKNIREGNLYRDAG